MKSILAIFLLYCGISLAGTPTLQVDKTVVTGGDKLRVTFNSGGAPVQQNAWIGIVPSNIKHGSENENDQHDVAYQYLQGKTEGTLEFDAPTQPGSYDFRWNDTDDNGKEIASVTFQVQAPKLEGTLSLDKKTLAPGEQFDISFTASGTLPGDAWVGIIPSNVPHGQEEVNDRYDVEYRYLEKKTSGTLSFTAPAEAGSYDLRMNSTDNNGVEIASVSFQVAGGLGAKAIAEALEKTGKVTLYGIHFDTNQATILPDSAAVLQQVSETLTKDPTLKLRIEGHTDNTGTPDHNMDLSVKRAESVKNYLVQKLGADPSRLTTRGFGDTQPVANNDNEGGRAQNRRVELVKE